MYKIELLHEISIKNADKADWQIGYLFGKVFYAIRNYEPVLAYTRLGSGWIYSNNNTFDIRIFKDILDKQLVHENL
jgi:hypothetical protein